MIYDALGYYKILDADYFTDDKIIKSNYLQKAKFWHPDHNTNEKALENFQKISVAYNILKNKKTKTIYNLLSLIYDEKNFPDIETLKSYKSADGSENPFLRVVNLIKFEKKTFKKEKIIGSFSDLKKYVEKYTYNNWFYGWLKPAENIKALKFNYKKIYPERDDNFKMLIHNTATYFYQDKIELAYISAKESNEFASENQKQIIYDFIKQLPEIKYNKEFFDFEYLRKIQLKYLNKIILFCAIFMIVCLSFISFNIFNFVKNKQTDSIDYYKEIHFNSGKKIVDDMALSQIFNIPINLNDDKKLFNIKSVTNIMYGPSENFDILTKSVKNQTVRITGYTPDKKWYRIMLDNGDMGFVKKEFLVKGIGNPIPDRSKIISKEKR